MLFIELLIQGLIYGCMYAIIAVGLILMGIVMPLMYSAFGVEMEDFIDSVPFFSQLIDGFGGGNVLSLTGSMAFAFQHPFTLLLLGIIAIAVLIFVVDLLGLGNPVAVQRDQVARGQLALARLVRRPLEHADGHPRRPKGLDRAVGADHERRIVAGVHVGDLPRVRLEVAHEEGGEPHGVGAVAG